MQDVQGNWSWRTTGTNNANVFAEIKQEGPKLFGIARINDLIYGTSVYNFTGVVEDGVITMTMSPDKNFLTSLKHKRY